MIRFSSLLLASALSLSALAASANSDLLTTGIHRIASAAAAVQSEKAPAYVRTDCHIAMIRLRVLVFGLLPRVTPS